VADGGDATGTPGRARLVARAARLVAAAGALGVSLLAVLEAPVSFLWKPAIAATELGHLVGAVALGLALAALPGARRRSGRVALGLALAAAALSTTPLLRARPVARDLPARLAAAFGEAAPRSFPDAPARPAPLVPGDLLAIESPAVAVSTHVYREVEGQTLRLDLYRREGARDAAAAPDPVVLAIHGGSWRAGDRTQLPDAYRYLAARGHAVAAIDTRLAPRFPFPAARDDVRAAVAWLGAEAGAGRLGAVDASRIVLYGRSAGGHLALLVAYDAPDPAIRGVVALYAPSDLVWSWENPANPLVHDSHGALRDFLGGAPADAPERYRAASPLGFVRAGVPPTLLIHGGRDELVRAEQSARLAARLAAAGVPHLHLELPWATHGCEASLAGPSGQLTLYAVERFLAAVAR